MQIGQSPKVLQMDSIPCLIDQVRVDIVDGDFHVGIFLFILSIYMFFVILVFIDDETIGSYI